MVPFFQVWYTWDLVMLVLVIGYWKEMKLCTWEFGEKMGPWVGSPTFAGGYIFNFCVSKVFDGDCFYTNFLGNFWNVVGYGDSVCF